MESYLLGDRITNSVFLENKLSLGQKLKPVRLNPIKFRGGGCSWNKESLCNVIVGYPLYQMK